jgi:glutamine cyclotransferase
MILAYIRTNGIVSAQLWMSDFSKQIEVRLGTIIKQIEINDVDSNLNLDDLIRKYPYEENSNNVDTDSNPSDGARTS